MLKKRTPRSDGAPVDGDGRAAIHRSIQHHDGERVDRHIMNGHDGIFDDEHGSPRVVRGVCIYSGSTRLAELATRIGFEAVWIEMEHGPTDFALAESICMAAEASGGVGVLRVPDGQRHHVLRAL